MAPTNNDHLPRSRRPSLFVDHAGDIAVSFEFFPPKTPAMEESLWSAVTTLAPLRPRFVSVTYGAGGSTRARTHKTVERILRETQLTPAAHLTCVGASEAEVDAVVRGYWSAGVRHIVALRGDPPDGAKGFTPHPQGYANAAALVAGIRAIGDFDISVGCYPEGHPEAVSLARDIDYLKAKIDAGANRAISQFFFEPDLYFRFLDRAAAAGIGVPLVPGILPVTNFKQLKTFAGRCGASVPAWMADLFEGLDERPATRNLVAATLAAEQCRRLYDGGVREFHFYTLNRAELAYGICHMLGLRATLASARSAVA
ncbi:MAG: methylenetetrahydrofolate reductase [NAD(P)H] [Pseudomonadota bacterium]